MGGGAGGGRVGERVGGLMDGERWARPPPPSALPTLQPSALATPQPRSVPTGQPTNLPTPQPPNRTNTPNRTPHPSPVTSHGHRGFWRVGAASGCEVAVRGLHADRRVVRLQVRIERGVVPGKGVGVGVGGGRGKEEKGGGWDKSHKRDTRASIGFRVGTQASRAFRGGCRVAHHSNRETVWAMTPDATAQLYSCRAISLALVAGSALGALMGEDGEGREVREGGTRVLRGP